MANKKKKILEEALKMHEAAGGTYSSPEAAAKQQYANARHETAKNAYNQESMAKAAERKRKAEAAKKKAERIAQTKQQVKTEAEETKTALSTYMQSDERKQKEEAHKKQELSRFTQQLLGGNADIMQPQMLRDEKEAQLRKEADKAGKTQTVLENAQASQERARETTSTEKADLAEIQTMTPEERRQLDEYIFNREQKFYSGFDPTKSDLMLPQMPVVSPLEQKYGKKRLDELAESQSRKNQREISEKALQDAAASAGGSGWDAVGHSALAVLAGASSGIGKGLDYLKDKAFGTGRYDGMDPNGAGSFLGNYAGTVQGTVADKIEGDTYDEEGNLIEDGGWLRKGLSMGYQGLMSAAESSVRALLFGGAAGGAAVAAADTFVDGVNEAMASGATQGQATSIGLAKAMVEFITEKIPMDRLTDLIKGGGKSLLRNMAAQAGEEATTEVASYAASILAEWGILREKSGYQQKIAKYILDGVNPEEAKKLVDREVLNEATQTAIVSGFAGAFGGLSGAYIGNKVEENAQGDLEQVIQPEESQPGDQQGGSPLSVQQDPVGQGSESTPVMPEEAASAPETRELDVVTQAVQQAQQNREAVQNAQQEPTLAQQLTPEQRVQEAVKGVRKKEEDGVKINTPETGGVWNKLRSYTQSEKENWKYSKRIVLCDGIENFRQFVSNALTSKEQTHKKMYFGAITQNLATEIKNATGVNVEGYNLSLGEDEIRKIKKSHGNEKTETSRGQRPVTEADYLVIPDIVQNADSIKRSDSDYEGKPALEFRKRNGNELTTVVAVVSDKRLDVFVQTAYINKKGGSIATPESVQADSFTPVATGGTAPVSEDPQGQKNVHPGATPKAESAGSSKEATQSTNMNSSMNIPAGSSVATIPQLPQEVNGNPAQESNYYDEFEDWGADPNREGVGNPLADRNYSEVGKRSIKAYMYENPAVKPFYQEQAAWLLSELADTTRGERTYNDQVYYESGGEKGWYGTKRHTSESIAELLDQDGMTYEQIERGLNAIIRDNGEENNAASKRIEFVINDRLMNGYTDFYSGERVPGNAEYLNLLRSQQQAEDNGQPAPEGMKGTGAAEQNFTGKAAYNATLSAGNAQADRRDDVRTIELPKRDVDGKNVSAVTGNVYGSKITPDELASLMEEPVARGDFTYAKITNDQATKRAVAAIESAGTWETAFDGWKQDVTKGVAGAEVSARGALLLNRAAETGNKQQWLETLHYMQMLGTNTAQGLQALRIVRTLSIPDKMAFTRMTVNNYIAALTKDGVKIENGGINALLDKFESASNDAQRDSILSDIQQNIADQVPSTFVEKWNALRYTNMLGNLKTQVRNIVGNMSMSANYMLKDKTAAAMENLVYHLSGKKFERTKSLRIDPKMKRAAMADFKQFADIVSDGGKYGDQLSAKDAFARGVEDKRTIFKSENRVIDAFLKPMEKYRRATNWAMNNERFGDEAFGRSAYANALAGYLQAHGVKDADLNKVDAGLMDKARSYAIQQAQEATFHDNSAFARTMSKLQKNTGILGQALLPFAKTPANVGTRAAEFSPLGFLKTAVMVAQKAASGNEKLTSRGGELGAFASKGAEITGADIVDSLAKNLTGTGLFVLGCALRNAGLISGGADENEEKDNFDKLNGEQNYAFLFPDGGSYTLDWLNPTAVPLFMGANLWDIVSEKSDLTFADLEQVFTAIAEPMLEMSMLQGVSDALDSVKYSDNNIVQLGLNAAVNYLSQGLTNTLLGQLEKSTEEKRMTTYVDKDSQVPVWAQKALGKASQKIPGWDYQQVPYINARGEEEKQPAGVEGLLYNTLSPGYYKEPANKKSREK